MQSTDLAVKAFLGSAESRIGSFANYHYFPSHGVAPRHLEHLDSHLKPAAQLLAKFESSNGLPSFLPEGRVFNEALLGSLRNQLQSSGIQISPFCITHPQASPESIAFDLIERCIRSVQVFIDPRFISPGEYSSYIAKNAHPVQIEQNTTTADGRYLANMACGICHVQDIYALVDYANVDGKAYPVPLQAPVAADLRPLKLLSTPAPNFVYGPAQNMDPEAILDLLSGMYNNIFNAARSSGCQVVILPPIGLGAFGDPGIHGPYHIDALLAAAKRYPDLHIIYAPHPANAAKFRALAENLSNVSATDKDVNALALEFQKTEYTCGLLNPSDVMAVFGSADIGVYWRDGHTVAEEVLGMFTTAPLGSLTLNGFFNPSCVKISSCDALPALDPNCFKEDPGSIAGADPQSRVIAPEVITSPIPELQIALKEKAHYPYLLFSSDGSNEIFIQVPIMGGIKFGTDNTCKTLTAMREFFGYAPVNGSKSILSVLRGLKKDLEEDICLLEAYGNMQQLIPAKRQKLLQVAGYLSLLDGQQGFLRLNQYRELSTVYAELPEPIKHLLRKKQNILGMVLDIRLGPDNFLRAGEAAAVFAARRTGNNTIGSKISAGAQNYTPQTASPKEAIIRRVAERLGLDITSKAFESLKTNPEKEPLFQAIKAALLSDIRRINPSAPDDKFDRSHYPGQPAINLEFITDVLCIDFEEASLAEVVEGILLSACTEEELQVQQLSPFVTAGSNPQALSAAAKEMISILVQMFFAQVNNYCYLNKLSNKNFAQVLDELPEHKWQELLGKLNTGLRVSRVEEELFSFIQGNRNLFLTNQQNFSESALPEIKQNFAEHWSTVASSPHYDEFIQLVDVRGDFTQLQGNIGVPLHRLYGGASPEHREFLQRKARSFEQKFAEKTYLTNEQEPASILINFNQLLLDKLAAVNSKHPGAIQNLINSLLLKTKDGKLAFSQLDPQQIAFFREKLPGIFCWEEIRNGITTTNDPTTNQYFVMHLVNVPAKIIVTAQGAQRIISHAISTGKIFTHTTLDVDLAQSLKRLWRIQDPIEATADGNFILTIPEALQAQLQHIADTAPKGGYLSYYLDPKIARAIYLEAKLRYGEDNPKYEDMNRKNNSHAPNKISAALELVGGVAYDRAAPGAERQRRFKIRFYKDQGYIVEARPEFFSELTSILHYHRQYEITTEVASILYAAIERLFPNFKEELNQLDNKDTPAKFIFAWEKLRQAGLLPAAMGPELIRFNGHGGSGYRVGISSPEEHQQLERAIQDLSRRLAAQAASGKEVMPAQAAGDQLVDLVLTTEVRDKIYKRLRRVERFQPHLSKWESLADGRLKLEIAWTVLQYGNILPNYSRIGSETKVILMQYDRQQFATTIQNLMDANYQLSRMGHGQYPNLITKLDAAIAEQEKAMPAPPVVIPAAVPIVLEPPVVASAAAPIVSAETVVSPADPIVSAETVVPTADPEPPVVASAAAPPEELSAPELTGSSSSNQASWTPLFSPYLLQEQSEENLNRRAKPLASNFSEEGKRQMACDLVALTRKIPISADQSLQNYAQEVYEMLRVLEQRYQELSTKSGDKADKKRELCANAIRALLNLNQVASKEDLTCFLQGIKRNRVMNAYRWFGKRDPNLRRDRGRVSATKALDHVINKYR